MCLHHTLQGRAQGRPLSVDLPRNEGVMGSPGVCRGLLQRELLAFAEEENDLPCEIEHLACGSGLKRIYRFLCHKDGISAQDYVRPLAPARTMVCAGRAVGLNV